MESFFRRNVLILLVFALPGCFCLGQQTPGTDLPEAPSPQQNVPTVPQGEQQTKRIMGMLPNFRSVSAGEIVPKETLREKFVTATLDNFDYTSLLFAGVIAANSFVTKETPEFRQGAAGYGRYTGTPWPTRQSRTILWN
jgi:hypothetical protein